MSSVTERPQADANGLDLIIGGTAIARYLGVPRRTVYRLQDQLPLFQLGGKLAARRSTLLAAIEAMERGEGRAA